MHVHAARPIFKDFTPHHYPAMSYPPHISPVQCPLISQHTDSKLRSMLLLFVPSPFTLTCLPNSSLDSSLLHHVRRSLHEASLPSPVPPPAHIAPGLWDEPISVPLLAPYCSQRELCTHAWVCHWLFDFAGRGGGSDVVSLWARRKPSGWSLIRRRGGERSARSLIPEHIVCHTFGRQRS